MGATSPSFVGTPQKFLTTNTPRGSPPPLFISSQSAGKKHHNMVLTAGIKPSPPMEPANAARKWFYGGGAAASQDVRKPNSGDYAHVRRIREAEKAEKIMHLICWGPTK